MTWLIRNPHPAAHAGRTAPADPAAAHFQLPLSRAALTTARGWLLLGAFSLLASGLFSVLLVLARTPYVKSLVPGIDLFHTALVVHVDLSVLVWFFALGGVLWCFNSGERAQGWLRGALALATGGALLLVAAPFGGGTPIMANYVPVLDSPIFLAALAIFGAGVGIAVGAATVFPGRLGHALDGTGALHAGLNAAALSALVALLAFAWSFATVPAGLDGKAYYELVFWGGGHVLQFTWTLLMLVAWLWLAEASGLALPLRPRVVVALFASALAFVLLTPVIYAMHDVTSVEHRRLLTWAMRAGGGLAVGPVAIAILVAFRRARRAAPPTGGALRSALAMSMLLFLSGGLIGFLIRGSTVTIPAHYHGCIVGVTLAFMGLAYHLMPRLGLGAPGGRLAFWQPIVYGGGQLLHIVGLMWSGGYGVQRKVAGGEQVLRTAGEVAGMALMGLGGLIAIVGGLMFLMVLARAWKTRDVEAR
ncbi:MAG: cbb3-type cytochrome c oxidase subunit I [Burkholderiales bacterium]